MPSEPNKAVANKFPLRLMPSMRRTAELFSQKEGVSLNQFINVAVAEKLAHLQHEEWNQRRAKPTEESIARVLRIIDNGPDVPPEPGDELPPGYVSIRDRSKPAPKRKA